MYFLARLFGIVLLLTTYYTLQPTSAYADSQFQTDYKVSYSIDPSGKTNVTQNIVLKNKTANYYADKFELKIGSTKVEDVKAADSAGPLKTDVKFENNVTVINVEFNQRVIGMEKSLPWTLSYSSFELATKSGQIWEVSIPRVGDSDDIGDYQASVSVPLSFGPVAFAVPKAQKVETLNANQTFTFDKKDLTQSGISMSFGQKQVFTFKLDYYLENNNLTGRVMDVALPPDNNYQKIVLDKIEPIPTDVVVDEDGNFLAKYKLGPKKHLDVHVEGSVEVTSTPFRKVQEQMTDQQKKYYTQPQRYWETDNAFITDKADQLKTPKAVYDFVTDYLSYNEERLKDSKLERKGAAQTTLTPKDSVCMEFTDLFIAIARSAGIPAREVIGYAYTQNERLRPLSLETISGDLLHAWPEYWDGQKGWVQIDPTWGSTSGGLDYFNKLDFNHITLVQRGISSTDPAPAGSYKRPNDYSKKSVDVQFSKDLSQPSILPQLTLNVPSKVIAGIPLKVNASISNSGSTSIVSGDLALDPFGLKNLSQNPVHFGILPPFSRREVTYELQTKGFFTYRTLPITLKFNDYRLSKEVQIVPVYNVLLSPAFAASAAIAAIVIATGFFLYSKRKKKLNFPLG